MRGGEQWTCRDHEGDDEELQLVGQASSMRKINQTQSMHVCVVMLV